MSGGVVSYELAGTSKSNKVEKYITNAWDNYFVPFLHSKEIELTDKTIRENHKTLLTDRSTYQEFGTFLIQRATSQNAAEHFTDGHALNILSYVLGKAKAFFPEAE